MIKYSLAHQLVEAECLIDGILVNPVLPSDFESHCNEVRPSSHSVWWHVPFVRALTTGTGRRFEVRCLDGGAWDRTTWYGSFDTLDEAITCAKAGPNWKQNVQEVWVNSAPAEGK